MGKPTEPWTVKQYQSFKIDFDLVFIFHHLFLQTKKWWKIESENKSGQDDQNDNFHDVLCETPIASISLQSSPEFQREMDLNANCRQNQVELIQSAAVHEQSPGSNCNVRLDAH